MGDKGAVRWEKGADGIAIVTLDDPGRSANTMNDRYKAAMGEVVDQLAAAKDELTGVIVVVRLSSPPGELIVVADGKDWTVIVGEPWLRARAGLSDSMLVKGVIATFQGHRAKDKNVPRMKAARVLIKGKPYDLSAPKT